MTTKPPFAFPGAKATLAPEIVALTPPHRVYNEPFAGSLAVLLAKPRSTFEYVNDLDGQIVNFWRVLRDHPEELERRCALTPYARDEYQAAWEPTDDPIEAARRFWVRVEQGIGRKIGSRSGWQASTSDGRGRTAQAMTTLRKLGRFAPAAERLAGVHIDNRDALDVLELYDSPDTLHYVDPPYHPDAHSAAGAYNHVMTADQHQALLEVLTRLDGIVVLSGYDSGAYTDALDRGWTRHELSARATTANRNAQRTQRQEVIWINRPDDRLSLFGP